MDIVVAYGRVIHICIYCTASEMQVSNLQLIGKDAKYLVVFGGNSPQGYLDEVSVLNLGSFPRCRKIVWMLISDRNI